MKKGMAAFLCLILAGMMIVSLSACGSSIQDDWASVIIGENLPTPQKGRLNDGSNSDDGFHGGIEKVDAEYYAEYKDACIAMGYTVDSKESGDRYEAFNSEGYDLSLSFYDNEIHITLIAPVELSEIEWPTTGIGAKLPATVSTMGKVTSDTSNCFRATVGNTTIDDYNNYVKLCEEKGFVVDYTKQDERYEAKNAEGYRLNVSYAGCNRIDVMIQTPKEENTTTTSSKQEETTTVSETESSNEETSTEEIGTDFKKAMDSYEEFFDEYVAFMKKYKESNGTDLSLLADYAKYLTTYAEMMEDFEKWEGEDLNTAEITYYIQVQSRISQKLLEVAQ